MFLSICTIGGFSIRAQLHDDDNDPPRDKVEVSKSVLLMVLPEF
jgi:hypothetical protein